MLTDKQWELLALLLPSSDGLRGRKFRNNRVVVEGMLYRLRTGLPWRDLPSHFGPWKTDPRAAPVATLRRVQRAACACAP
ncbi:transposase [Rhodococcus sp. JVH1]|uniref:transposase n=1 Tax=Rhodococcus sp. JVH1 TaxID=745408 RepID=UPI003523FBEA